MLNREQGRNNPRVPTEPRKRPKEGYRPKVAEPFGVGSAVRDAAGSLGWVTNLRDHFVEVRFEHGGLAVLEPKVAGLTLDVEAPAAPRASKPPSPPPTSDFLLVRVDSDLVEAIRKRFTTTRRTGGHVVKVGQPLRKVIDLARQNDGDFMARALVTPINPGPTGDGRVARRKANRVDKLLKAYGQDRMQPAFLAGLSQIEKEFTDLRITRAKTPKRRRMVLPRIQIVSGGLPSLGKRS